MTWRHFIHSFVLLICVGMLPGCDSGADGEPCEEGTAGCPCLASDLCFDHDEQPMTCVENRCVAQDCAPGSLDCPCFANGTCGLHAGEPLACLDDRCTLAEEPEAGALGGRCGRNLPCEDSTLVCEANRCQLAGCDTATLGCPCGPLGACADVDGRETRCRDGRCVYRDCSPGALGCPCDETICADGARCEGGVCRSDAVLRLHVQQRSVRACDVDFGRAADDVTIQFLGPVVGRAQRAEQRVAAGFFAREDARLNEPLAELRFPSSREDGMNALRVEKFTCYDGNGAVIPEPGVELR